MTDTVHERMSASHAQALRSTLLEVFEFTERAHELLKIDAESPDGKHALTPDSADAIRQRVREVETRARELMTRHRLPEGSRNIRGELRAYSSRAWADLIDSESRAMHRYGDPPGWYAKEIDPILERMAAVAHEILYYSREPERE